MFVYGVEKKLKDNIIKFKPFSDNSLSEIYQQVNMQFAFISPDNEQSHTFVLCRDFLHDAVKAYLNKSSCEIYRFRYDYNVNPCIDMDNIKFCLDFHQA